MTSTLFADETYAQLAPLEDVDAQNGYALRALVRALGSMFAQPEEAVRALGDGKAPWERVFDADRAPVWLLPFVGRAVGVVVDTTKTPAEQRAQIKAESAWHRCTPAAIQDAVRATLFSAVNRVPNPSFEHNGSAVASGWASSGAFIATGSTATPAGGAFTGTICQQVVTGAVAKRGIEAGVPGIFQAGIAYTASIYAKGSAGGEKVKLIFGSSVGPEEVSAELTLTTGWQRLSVTWTPAANRVSAELAIQHPEATNVTFFVDAALVAAGTTPPEYHDGDSPGWRWLGQPAESTSVNVSAPPAERIRMVERNSTAWTLLIITSPKETPDIEMTRAATQAATPGGIVVTVELSEAPLIDEMTKEIDLITAHTIDTLTLADVT